MRNLLDKIAKALGYVRAEPLTTENRNLGWALEATKDELGSLQNRNARLEAKCRELSDQAKRLQREADELLTAKANQRRYGIPIGQAFSVNVRRHKGLESGLYQYQIGVKPNAAAVSFVISSWALEDLKEQPEVVARRVVLDELVPQLELEIARALKTGADEAVSRLGAGGGGGVNTYAESPRPLADRFGR